jgi:hypothetical protein
MSGSEPIRVLATRPDRVNRTHYHTLNILDDVVGFGRAKLRRSFRKTTRDSDKPRLQTLSAMVASAVALPPLPQGFQHRAQALALIG